MKDVVFYPDQLPTPWTTIAVVWLKLIGFIIFFGLILILGRKFFVKNK